MRKYLKFGLFSQLQCNYELWEFLNMSEERKERLKVPEGKTEYVTTRQMDPNEKGFVGYETIWKSFQKESEYQTPKKP